MNQQDPSTMKPADLTDTPKPTDPVDTSSPTNPTESTKSARTAEAIKRLTILLLVAAYSYTIPTSFVQLTSAGFPTLLTVILCPITGTFAIFLTILAVGSAVIIGCAIAGLLIGLYKYFFTHHKSHHSRQKKG